MSVGFCGTAHREPPTPKLFRVLWRMRGATRVAVAGLFEHPVEHACELRVWLGPMDNVVYSQVERFDFGPLETKADELRERLRLQGWWPLPLEND